MKFIITASYPVLRFMPPRIVEAENKVEALTQLGLTVWTEEEWSNKDNPQPDNG